MNVELSEFFFTIKVVNIFNAMVIIQTSNKYDRNKYNLFTATKY